MYSCNIVLLSSIVCFTSLMLVNTVMCRMDLVFLLTPKVYVKLILLLGMQLRPVNPADERL